jgi:hypothetical protein
MSRPLFWLHIAAFFVFITNSPIFAEPVKLSDKDGPTAKEGRALQKHFGEVMALAFSPDGRWLASAGNDGSLMVSELATGKVVLDRTAHESGAYATAFSPDGKLMATAGVGGSIRLWDVPGWKVVRTISVPTATLSALAFAPDGKTLACGDYDKGFSLWDPATGRKLWEATSTGRVTSLAYSPDGKTVVSGGTKVFDAAGIPMAVGDSVTLWSAATGKKLRTLPGRGSTVAFAGDGHFVLGGALVPDVDGRSIDGYEVIRAWRPDSGDELMSIPWCGSGIALAPDGLLLASCRGSMRHFGGGNLIGPNGENARRTAYTLRLWDSATGVVVAKFPEEDTTVVAFSADGRTLAAARREGQVLTWDVLEQGRDARAKAPKGLEALWAELGGHETVLAFRARCALTLAGDKAVAFLAERVKVPAESDVKVVREHLARLDGDEFATREAAQEALKELGPAVAPLLREALDEKPSAEARRRIQELLDEWRGRKPSPDELRGLRAVAVVEAVGTPEARQFLQKLAKGPAGARLTAAAKAALARLERVPSARP